LRSASKYGQGAAGSTTLPAASVSDGRQRHQRLRVEGLTVDFGGLRAIDAVDLHVERGEIFGLIGPNGAGKTTMVNSLTGFQRPTAGRVFLDDTDVTGWAPARLARVGVVRTFQNVRLYARLTVRQNLELGAIGIGVGRGAARGAADGLLERLGLGGFADADAEGLPHGIERRVAIARALAARPDFLLLDEPAAGLNENESADLVAALSAVRDDVGCGLLVIEHDMSVIMRLCERIQVLDHGKTISIGTPAAVRADEAVLTAYLGTRH
jgi:branched-chain amino acid transport system ATP-binding protein